VTAEGSTHKTSILRRRGDARRLPTVLGLQLLHLLGSGGEGEVWAAADRDGTVHAVKLIRPDVVAEPVTFGQRAEALARIDDPAFVRVLRARVLGTGDWAGWGAMVMELVDGEPLDDAHLGARAFADLEPLALALDRLHDGVWSDGEPMVHRDVKPANLVRTDDDRVVLVDPSSLRAVGGDMTYVGTPLYVAPEVPAGHVGPAADVYSLAATLLALHSGARGRVLADLLASPDELDVPEGVARALSPAPDERPERCADLVDTTHTVVVRADADPATRPPTGPQTSRTWWRLGLLAAAAAPLAVGLLLTIPVVAIGALLAVAALVALDPALRDPGLAWLPLSVARWLARTLETDDGERERVEETVHGALLLPLLPLVGYVVGLGPQLVVYGTIGQIAGVLTVCAVAATWYALATADPMAPATSPARIAVLPLWVAGTFAAAVTRVAVALDDALRSEEPASPIPGDGGADTDDAAADDRPG
jgi:hypothetical protein